MKLTYLQLILFFFINLTLSESISGQNYFKIMTVPPSGYYQKLSQFPNGDILLGDKIFLNLMPAGGFYLIRVNDCGDIIWSKIYRNTTNKILSFTQVAINDSGEIFVHGAEIDPTNSNKGYILKLSGSGMELIYKTFSTNTSEHPYSLSVKNGLVMLFGLSRKVTTIVEKFNSILILDEDLNYIWGKHYQPFDSYNEATLTKDNGVIYATGNIIVKIDALGNVQWGKYFGTNIGPYTLSVPLDVSDGYVFGAFSNGGNWFFKLDQNGNLVWKTNIIPSYYHVSSLELLFDNNIIAAYHRLSPTGNIPCFLTISSNGEIMEQYQLNIDLTINTGFTYITVTEDKRINLFGNANMDAFNGEYSEADFLMQFNLEELHGECFFWEKYEDQIINNFDLNFVEIPINVSDVSFNLESENSIAHTQVSSSFIEICEFEKQEIYVEQDTTLGCNENWTVSLPDDSFSWRDGNTDNPRILFLPETYIAESSTCTSYVTYEYRLEKEICPCEIFIPNAISPNKNGQNDELEIFSNCIVTDLDLKIFNRWGAVVFQSNQFGKNWDGTLKGKPVPSGVYIVMTTGTIVDTLGNKTEFRKYQDVTVVR